MVYNNYHDVLYNDRVIIQIKSKFSLLLIFKNFAIFLVYYVNFAIGVIKWLYVVFYIW